MRINILHSVLLAPALLVAAALTVQPALAASRVHVPFNFSVGRTACPAGVYTVTQDNDGTTLRLGGGRQSFVWIVGPGAPSPNDTRTILTFDKIGSAYLLRTVQYGASITSRLDRPGKESIPVPEQVVAGQ